MLHRQKESGGNLFSHGRNVCQQSFVAGSEFGLALVEYIFQLHSAHVTKNNINIISSSSSLTMMTITLI